MMKTKMLAGAAVFTLAIGTLAQGGNFLLDDTTIPNGLAVNLPGNWYNGTFGMEVWVLKGTANIPAGINLAAAPGSGVLGYQAMEAAGLLREATYANRQTVGPGDFEIASVFMPDAHDGGTVVLALAAWNTSAPSWGAMLATANQATRAGIVVFHQPTFPTLANPGVPPGLAMDQDLVLTAITEPSAIVLADLGGALLLLGHCRTVRRKRGARTADQKPGSEQHRSLSRTTQK